MDERDELLERALGYPYAIPRRSFALSGGRALELDAVDVDRGSRVPLLAYGSNAAPEVLARKLDSARDPVPVVRTALRDFDVVYSAHVSRYGAVPATLSPSPGTEVPAFVAYLTPEQLRLLSATEPNYELASFSRDDDPEELRIYLSRHGCLLLDGGEVALSAIEARGRTRRAMSQRQVLERVRDGLFPGRTLSELVALARGYRLAGRGRSL